jgi:hypothetical protein
LFLGPKAGASTVVPQAAHASRNGPHDPVGALAVSTDSHRRCWLNFEVERRNADPSARRLNSFAAQQRRGEFSWLAQDDILLCLSKFC